MKYKVSFKDVGGMNKCWDAIVSSMDYKPLAKEVHSKCAILSRHPEFAVDDDGTGSIFCGLRCCGTFTWSQIN